MILAIVWLAETTPGVRWRYTASGTVEAVSPKERDAVYTFDASGAIAAMPSPGHARRARREWRSPVRLGGWVPVSVGQLRAVQDIADRYDGAAFVRPRDGGSVDVVARSFGRATRGAVDAFGTLDVSESSELGPVVRTLATPAIVILALASLAADVRGAVVAAGVVAVVATLVITYRGPDLDDLESWHRVLTVEERDD